MELEPTAHNQNFQFLISHWIEKVHSSLSFKVEGGRDFLYDFIWGRGLEISDKKWGEWNYRGSFLNSGDGLKCHNTVLNQRGA